VEKLGLTSNPYSADFDFDEARVKRSPPQNRAENWLNQLYKLFCAESAADLSKMLQERGHNRFVLGFDECTLLDAVGSTARNGAPIRYPLDGMTLMALRRIIKASDKFTTPAFRYWHFLLDTNSSTDVLYPRKSSRVESFYLIDSYKPLPPWHYFEFDCMLKQGLEELANAGELTNVPDTLRIQLHRLYGRPVSSTFIKTLIACS
jgi:hypothetical protein